MQGAQATLERPRSKPALNGEIPPQLHNPLLRKWFRGRRTLAKIFSTGVVIRLLAERWLGELLGAAVIGRRWLSDVPPRQVVTGIPRAVDARLRLIVMLRGILHDNFIFRSSAERNMRHLLGAVSARNPEQQAEPLPELHFDELSGDDFYESYVRNPHPVVVRGGARQVTGWTVENLIRRFPHTPVLLTDMHTGRNRTRPLRDVKTWRDAKGRPAYVHNCERILADHPELYGELDLMRYWKLLRIPYHTAQLFLGSYRGSGAPFHCANNFNAFLMLEGRKRWTFVDPNYTMFMYPYLSTGNTYQASNVGFGNDPQHLAKLPLYAYCPRYEVELEPGDMLLNPPWWYHAVENMTETSVGLATRWLGPYFSPIKDTNHLYTFLHFWHGRLLRPLHRVWTDLLVGDQDVASMHKQPGAVHKNRTVFEDESHDRIQSEFFTGQGLEAWKV